MSKNIPVSYHGKHKYNIHIRNDFTDLAAELALLDLPKTSKICIVTDSNVRDFYLDVVQAELTKHFEHIYSFCFEAGEQQKNLDTVSELYEYLIENHFDRKDYLLALGGGVVGDLTGFAAATYLRGIPFIQVPTTLLSQVDSSIGGKTGVDCMKYKNMVGAFYQPLMVYMNLSVLNTLDSNQFSSGMGEIIKHSLIKNKKYFEWIKEHTAQIKLKDILALEEMIYESCMIKKHVVEIDPTEQGDRALLNYGHTIGHAVEKLMNFEMLHGHCVAIGSISASYLSMKLGHITKDEYDMIKDLFFSFNLPVSLNNSGLCANDILAATKSDKKMEAGKIKFILLHTIGDAYITKELNDANILDAIEEIL
ncbi:3-dehydroquinate synthase [Eubacterium oxidoreducens]|uniref:3-dehydroquinate synthase n=1 Tax=Eubacterium oxidoreducens TaxID=1732 RepID=A0A1G6ALR4_EUBOX|nr:3-dehydroquinate synthase [Eubacterium oxidoreducens]SDB09290.1 3-dehydroquinate synthase [Eubacterium oxidoreducens]